MRLRREMPPGLLLVLVLGLAGCAAAPAPAPAPAAASVRAATPDVTGETRGNARLLQRGMIAALAKDENQCPTFDALRAAGLIARDVPLRDAWGGEFRGYCNDEGMAQVRSAGPDGRFDTPDDIVEGNVSAK
jgi:hypothetical protein